MNLQRLFFNEVSLICRWVGRPGKALLLFTAIASGYGVVIRDHFALMHKSVEAAWN